MKKAIIITIIVLMIIGIVYLVTNKSKALEQILTEFDSFEKDGYYDNTNGQEAGGYIVSNKTQEGYRYGYVNYKGKILLEPEYNQIYRILDIDNKNKIYLIAAKDGRYGVSLNGKNIIKYEYQFIQYNSQIEGFILQRADSYGVVNTNGKIVIPVENDYIEVKGKYIYVSNDNQNKVYNKNGKEEKIDFDTSLEPTENENYLITIVDKGEHYYYGVKSKEGKELIEPSYIYIEYLFDDYFIASKENGKEGIIDSNNNTKLEFAYTLVQNIQNTNIIRTLNNETNETELYSQNFEKLYVMKNANIEKEGNTIKVYNEEETKYFDSNGKIIEK